MGVLKRGWYKVFGLVFGIVAVLFCMVGSIIFGLTDITWNMVIDAYAQFDGSNTHIVIKEVRVPRAFIAAAVGASLAIAGALMQGLMRNPLASPDIFGINAGAGFFIVLLVSLMNVSSLTYFSWAAFIGAAITTAMVFFLGVAGQGRLTPMKLTLAGAAMHSLFSALTQGILVLNETALDEVLFWLEGSVQGRDLEMLGAAFPYLLAGWLLSWLVASQMNTLMMGEDVAKGLGQRTILVKLLIGLIIVLLAGSSVAIAGPILFIGVVIPHIARWFVGSDYRWVIPYSGLLGATLLLLADIGARYIIMPDEVPVGVMTALIGVPFFVSIARRGFNQP